VTWFRRKPRVFKRVSTQPYRNASARVVDPIMEQINREFKRMQGHSVPDPLVKPDESI